MPSYGWCKREVAINATVFMAHASGVCGCHHSHTELVRVVAGAVPLAYNISGGWSYHRDQSSLDCQQFIIQVLSIVFAALGECANE